MAGLDSSTSRHWDFSFLSNNDLTTRSRRALIILNQPFSPNLLQRVWNACSWRSCADGGANRLYDALQDDSVGDAGLKRSDFIPDLIKGDLDSIRPDVRQYYEDAGVPVIKDEDQDATDLMKCADAIRELERASSSEPEYTILILGGLSGRLDQTIHTLSFLHKLRLSRSSTFAITDDTLGWVLSPGTHTIQVDQEHWGPTCGLLPVGVSGTRLTTRGLRWNLDKAESSFDGLVSTSNHIASDEVHITTTQPIWWCMEVKHPKS